MADNKNKATVRIVDIETRLAEAAAEAAQDAETEKVIEQVSKEIGDLFFPKGF